MASLHDYRATSIDGTERPLSDFAGQALLVVNVASECGLTPHYTGLETLHRRFEDRGFSVLGFPCNQFGGQEPGSEEDIASFCRTRFEVSFPLFAKTLVNGANRHPVYAFLTSQESVPDGPGDVAWNFAKFVVDREGRVAARFAPPTEPLSDEIVQAVERVL